jgi:hypothetical protein
VSEPYEQTQEWDILCHQFERSPFAEVGLDEMGPQLGHFLERDGVSEAVEERQMLFLESEGECSCIGLEKRQPLETSVVVVQGAVDFEFAAED